MVALSPSVRMVALKPLRARGLGCPEARGSPVRRRTASWEVAEMEEIGPEAFFLLFWYPLVWLNRACAHAQEGFMYLYVTCEVFMTRNLTSSFWRFHARR